MHTTRRYRTVQIRAGQHLLTAEDPIPDDLRDALALITDPEGAHQLIKVRAVAVEVKGLVVLRRQYFSRRR